MRVPTAKTALRVMLSPAMLSTATLSGGWLSPTPAAESWGGDATLHTVHRAEDGLGVETTGARATLTCREPYPPEGPHAGRSADRHRRRRAPGDPDRHPPRPRALREHALREPQARDRSSSTHRCRSRARWSKTRGSATSRAGAPRGLAAGRLAAALPAPAPRAHRRAARAQVRLERLGDADRAAGARAGDRRARAHLVVRGPAVCAVPRPRADRPRQRRSSSPCPRRTGAG